MRVQTYVLVVVGIVAVLSLLMVLKAGATGMAIKSESLATGMAIRNYYGQYGVYNIGTRGQEVQRVSGPRSVSYEQRTVRLANISQNKQEMLGSTNVDMGNPYTNNADRYETHNYIYSFPENLNP